MSVKRLRHRSPRVRDELPRRNTVTEAIYDAGYNSSEGFYAKASEVLGMTATKARATKRNQFVLPSMLAGINSGRIYRATRLWDSLTTNDGKRKVRDD